MNVSCRVPRQGVGWMVLALLLAGCPAHEATQSAAALPTIAPGQRIRGATFDARADPGVDVLDSLHALGLTHVALTVFAFQPALDAPELRMNPDARWFSESDAGIRRMAAEGRAAGVRVVLKPHLWVRGGWTGDIAMRSEADWQAWEAQYRLFALHYARLSAEIEAPLFVVGAELGRAVAARPAFWRSLIDEVRAVYPGPVTYAANWHDDYENVAFWDRLDYVGVQAYFPLAADARPPDSTALRQAWEPHVAALRRVARQTGRPVLFTEIGYRSVPYAAREPWRWPERDEDTAPDPDLQARLYQAFFDTVWPQPWFAGALFWKLYPPGAPPRLLDFTPQGKPAEAVLKRGFAGGRTP